MWRKAGDKMYSIQAIASTLKAEKTSFAKEYALFAAKNRYARKFYAEGKAEGYPQAPIFDSRRHAQEQPTPTGSAGTSPPVVGSMAGRLPRTSPALGSSR